jgi:hypothetical protein
VNGVDWSTYGVEITSAYTDKAFFGDYPIEFWDHFPAPPGGYPVTLPPPLGHGIVPPDVLGRYRNVIWVGNDLNGDLDTWVQSPMLPYLRAGGNLLLMTRLADGFLADSLKVYLGITLTSTSTTFDNCLATRPGLVNLSRIGTQNTCVVFDTVRTRADSELLWKTTNGFTPQRGLGVIRMPAGGAGQRLEGGRFAFLSGRPYRWSHTQLRSNVSAILDQYFLEPLSGVGVPVTGPKTALAPIVPNPSPGERTLRFVLAAAGPVELELLDVTGRRVLTLASGILPAGPHERTWDGLDARGGRVAAGIYFVRLRAGGRALTERFVQLP